MNVISFDPTSDLVARTRYDELFETCPMAFVQQSTYWSDVVSELGPDLPIFLLLEDDKGLAIGGLPLYHFKGSAGAILTSVPQAGPLGGVFIRPGVNHEEAYKKLLEAAAQTAIKLNCLALTTMTNPFDQDLALYEQFLKPDLIFENFTQIVDVHMVVRHGEWVLPNNAQRNPERTIRKSKSSGLEVHISDDLNEFEAWYCIHQQRHRELSLTPLSWRLLNQIRSELVDKGKAFVTIATLDGEIAAGCIYVYHQEVCDCFIMSMNSAYKSMTPNYLLTEAAFFKMAHLGIRYMNWQSSPRRHDGVYAFKKQWGSIERPYYFLTRFFGDPASIRSLGIEGIKRDYPGHFVVPFGYLDPEGASLRYFSKT